MERHMFPAWEAKRRRVMIMQIDQAYAEIDRLARSKRRLDLKIGRELSTLTYLREQLIQIDADAHNR